jgi:mRNA deadenylase 3'-5' endonuclease subunit Ccr4
MFNHCSNDSFLKLFKHRKHPLNPIINVPTQFSNQKLTSVYKNILKREPKITILKEHFKDCLDYIFINNKFKIIAILNELPESYLQNIKYLPNKNHPSDHIPLKAIIDYI